MRVAPTLRKRYTSTVLIGSENRRETPATRTNAISIHYPENKDFYADVHPD